MASLMASYSCWIESIAGYDGDLLDGGLPAASELVLRWCQRRRVRRVGLASLFHRERRVQVLAHQAMLELSRLVECTDQVCPGLDDLRSRHRHRCLPRNLNRPF